MKKRKANTKKELKYIDGKSHENSNSINGVRSSEDLMRTPGTYEKFKSSSEEEFDEKIASMSLPELQSLAVGAGVFPSGNRTTLKNKLKKEFKKEKFSGKGRVFSSSAPILDESKLSKEQKKLFNLS